MSIFKSPSFEYLNYIIEEIMTSKFTNINKKQLQFQINSNQPINISGIPIKYSNLEDIYFFINKLPKRIATGTYGEVFKVLKKKDGKNYALKIVSINRFFEDSSITDLSSVIREILILEQFKFVCTDLNIVCITDFYYTKINNKISICFEMELLSSVNNISSLEDKIESFVECLKTLFILHKYILHRDVKPDNLLYDSNTRRLKFADFGVCCLKTINCYPKGYPTSKEIIQKIKEGELLNYAGTKDYLDPVIRETQQLLGPRITDISSDIYSLGVTFFEIIVESKLIMPQYDMIPVFNSSLKFYETWVENVKNLDSFYEKVYVSESYREKLKIVIEYIKLMIYPISKDVRPSIEKILDDYKKDELDNNTSIILKTLINNPPKFFKKSKSAIELEKSREKEQLSQESKLKSILEVKETLAKDIILEVKPKIKEDLLKPKYMQLFYQDSQLADLVEKLFEKYDYNTNSFKNS